MPQTLSRLSEEECLELERAAEFKTEFFDGGMFAMSRGTLRRSLISTNLARKFGNRLEGGLVSPAIPTRASRSLRPAFVTYPDLSVIRGEPQLLPGTEDVALNPTLLAEVLSDSTEAYDRGKKFEHHRLIETLRDYLLVSQKEPPIEHFSRGSDGRWLLNAVRAWTPHRSCRR